MDERGGERRTEREGREREARRREGGREGGRTLQKEGRKGEGRERENFFLIKCLKNVVENNRAWNVMVCYEKTHRQKKDVHETQFQGWNA